MQQLHLPACAILREFWQLTPPLSKALLHNHLRQALTQQPYLPQYLLPLKEFELLEFLVRNSGRVLTRTQLIDRVWGSDYFGDTKTLDVHVKRLRSKIEIDPANPLYIQTIRGLGYKFES